MTFISSLAMWFSNSKGKVVIEWFGWQVTTTPSFLIISVIFIFFFIYILLSLILSLYNIPKKTLLKIKLNRGINLLSKLLGFHRGIFKKRKELKV